MEELWDDYLQYLIWRGGLQKMRKYGNLFAILHNIKFTWRIDRDENRESDGVELRDGFNIPNNYDIDEAEYFMGHWCSVLEMLIGLAIRVDDEFIGDPAEPHPEFFFVEMIKNLGLDQLVNGLYCEYDVTKIIRRWLDREFDSRGFGSPFPVRHDHRDQKNLEIWDQMNSYINENYY